MAKKMMANTSPRVVYQRPLETSADYAGMVERIRIIGQQAKSNPEVRNKLLHGTGFYTTDGKPKSRKDFDV